MQITRRTCLHMAAASVLASWVPPVFGGEDKRADLLHIAMISGSAEYHSDESMTAFAGELEKNYRIRCSKIFGKDGAGDPLPGLEAIDTADLVLTFTRRLKPPKEQLERFKKYCEFGKPLIGVRTASHGFADWLEFDREVLGGNYKNHYNKDGSITQVTVAEKAATHPILSGVEPFTSASTLYRNTGMADDNELLLTGTIPGHTEPLAWTRRHQGGRVFYTSLGSPEDFKNEMFHKMLVNALFWAVQRNAVDLKR